MKMSTREVFALRGYLDPDPKEPQPFGPSADYIAVGRCQ